MPRIFRPPLFVSASFITGLTLHTVSVFADSAQADTTISPRPPESSVQEATNPNISTVDSPASYRYLDWLSPEAIQALPPEQRPITRGVCEGAYLAPVIQRPDAPADPRQAPVEATADSYETSDDGSITLTGDVIIQQGGRQLESDRIVIQQKTRETRLEGNVRIRQEGMLMTGSEGSFNLNEKNLSLTDAEYVVHDSHIRGTATRIHNENEDVLVFDKSSYTTCEPDSNAWLFEASDIRLNRASGWGTAKHAVIRVKDVPVFYFPWLMFPIDDRRQSGFLFPSFSSGEDNGTTVAVPYYLNLAPNYDATLTPRYIGERGEQLEAEFRYLTLYGEGELGAAYLPDDQSLDEETRDLLLWQHDGYFAGDWYSRVDYTRVSDDDYFQDLATSLNAKSQTHLNQLAQVGYTGNHLSGSLLVQRYQTIDELITDADLPYRKQPQFRLDGAWELASAGFRAIWQSETTRFEHPVDDFAGVVEADRITLKPAIEYRYRKPWALVTPRLQLIHSQYDFTSNTAGDSLNEEQTLYTASLDTRLFFERDLDVSGDAYLQTLEPRLFYLYRPFKEQDHRQTFDSSLFTFDYSQLFRENRFAGNDRFGDANQLSLGLSTAFIEESSGWERFRASAGQIFYFRDREVQLNESIPDATEERSAWVGRVEWRVNEYLRASADAQWDEDNNNIDRANGTLNYSSPERGILNLSYRYADDGAATTDVEKIRQSDFSFVWPASEHWSLLGRWAYDLEYDRSFENLLGVEYDSCCWRVRLVNRRYLTEDSSNPAEVEAQRGIFLQFQLKGLGGVGNELDGVLSDSISGFEYREQQLSNF